MLGGRGNVRQVEEPGQCHILDMQHLRGEQLVQLGVKLRILRVVLRD